jgi:hypothetical protein
VSIETSWPAPLRAAVVDRTSGATGVARQVIDGLLELTGDSEALHAAADELRLRLPGYAPVWHIARAARSADPGTALRNIRRQLDVDVRASVAAAVRLLSDRDGSIRTAPSSALVKQVVATLPAGAGAGRPVTGLAGADAVSPTTVLNIRSTRELAEAVPTVVVTTSLKLVPEDVFDTLGSPTFERIPLRLFEAVVLDGEVLDPAEAGRRAAAVR